MEKKNQPKCDKPNNKGEKKPDRKILMKKYNENNLPVHRHGVCVCLFIVTGGATVI